MTSSFFYSKSLFYTPLHLVSAFTKTYLRWKTANKGILTWSELADQGRQSGARGRGRHTLGAPTYRMHTQANIHEADWGIKMCCSGGQFVRAVHTMRHWKLRSFCPCFMTHEFKPAEFHATFCGDKILSPQQNFFAKTGMSHEENCRCNMSPLHVPATCPLVCADLKCSFATDW